MVDAQGEKRAARRFPLHIPVEISRNGNGQEPAQVRDVSARGICLYLNSTVEEGSPLAFTLTLPPEITLTESIRVQCKGRVIRTESGTTDGTMVVAAVIDEYEFLPEG